MRRGGHQTEGKHSAHRRETEQWEQRQEGSVGRLFFFFSVSLGSIVSVFIASGTIIAFQLLFSNG